LHQRVAERVQNERRSMFVLQKKTLWFDEYNKQFANHCEFLKCPPPAFTPALNFLNKIFNSFADRFRPCGKLCLRSPSLWSR